MSSLTARRQQPDRAARHRLRLRIELEEGPAPAPVGPPPGAVARWSATRRGRVAQPPLTTTVIEQPILVAVMQHLMARGGLTVDNLWAMQPLGVTLADVDDALAVGKRWGWVSCSFT